MESEFRKQERLNKIRQNFYLLKKARDWFQSDTKREMNDEALARVESIYDELDKLGVGKTFSAAVFIWGYDALTAEQFKHV